MKKYDVVIIGSGLGGLLSANILLKEGYSVCVLEKNRQFGGALQIFVRDKVIHDTGVHYIGALAPGQNLHQFFSYFGIMEDLNIKRLSLEAFDEISFQGEKQVYKLPQSYQRFEAQLSEYFPEERNAIQTYCLKLQEIAETTAVYNFEPFEAGNLSPYLNVGLKDYLDELTSNEKLKKVLMGNNILYAGNVSKTSLYEHALIIHSYISSAWKCVDGGAQIANLLVKKIKELGGKIRNYAEVGKLLVNDTKEIEAVQLKSGEKILAKNVISNVHPSQTLKMVGAEYFRKSYYERMINMENSISVFSVFINFKENCFPAENKNFYHFRSDDFWDASDYDSDYWPKSFAAFLPEKSRNQEFADSMNVMCYMRYDEVKKWEDSFHTVPKFKNERGSDYQAFKAWKIEQVIQALEERFPNIRACIKSVHSASPLSYRDYLASPEGSMYGMVKDYQNSMATYLSHNTKLKNLYFTGQNLNLHGILGVTISSFVTCSAFVDLEELLGKVKESK